MAMAKGAKNRGGINNKDLLRQHEEWARKLGSPKLALDKFTGHARVRLVNLLLNGSAEDRIPAAYPKPAPEPMPEPEIPSDLYGFNHAEALEERSWREIVWMEASVKRSIEMMQAALKHIQAMKSDMGYMSLILPEDAILQQGPKQ
jgi:hypothetical protein